jgi:hypothetical protein
MLADKRPSGKFPQGKGAALDKPRAKPCPRFGDGRHSEKPETFYNIVRKESYLPAGEAFQRTPRSGFVSLFADTAALRAAE